MKRCKAWIVLLLVLVSGIGMSSVAHAGEMPTIPLTTKHSRIAGDANKDGAVDLRDVVMVRRYLTGGWNVTIDTSAADVNADKIVDLKDVVLMRRYLAGGWGVTLK